MHVHVSETELKRKLHRSVTIVLSLLESRQNYYHVGIVTLPSLELVVNRIACSICSNGGGSLYKYYPSSAIKFEFLVKNFRSLTYK